jgi:citrate lyase gamma subunit
MIGYSHELMRASLQLEGLINIYEVIQTAQDHKREYAPTAGSYDSEVETRVDYVRGSMEKDLAAKLQAMMPNSYEDVWRKRAFVPLVKYLYGHKIGSTFKYGGQVDLKDASGEMLEVDDPRVKALQTMVERAKLWAALKSCDAFGVVSNRTVAKAWFDSVDGRVKVDSYSMNHVNACLHPHFSYSLDMAPTVAFYKGRCNVGVGTDSTANDVWEIWAKLAPDDKRRDTLNLDSLVYEQQGGKSYPFGEGADAAIPYRDPLTGEPVYPFVLVKYDVENDVYYLDKYGMLETNRRLNELLTDIQFGWLFNMHPAPVLENQGGSSIGGEAPKAVTASPAEALTIPEGWTLNFKKPDGNVAQAEESVKLLAKLEGRMHGVDIEVAFDGNQGPASGVSIRIRKADLDPIVADIRGIVHESYQEFIRRMIIVHDHHVAQGDLDAVQINPKGDLDVVLTFARAPVVDPAEVTSVKLPLVERNIYSVVDLRMELTGETRAQAIEAIERNASENDEYSGKVRLEGIAESFGDVSKTMPDASDDNANNDSEQPTEVAGKARIDRVNVYEMARAIEVGAATAIDLRMSMFGEDRETAQRRITEAEAFNLAMAEVQGERTLTEAKAAGGVDTTGTGTEPVKPIVDPVDGDANADGEG